MKRWAVAIVAISLLIFALTSIISHPVTDPSSLANTENGWPVAYKSDQYASIAAYVCPGINGTLDQNNNQNECSPASETSQTVKLVYDFLFWLAICSIAGYGLYALRRGKQPTDRQLSIVVGGSLVANFILWILVQNSGEQLVDYSGWTPPDGGNLMILIYLSSVVFLAATLVYLIRLIAKHPSTPKLIVRAGLCLVAIAAFFTVIIAYSQ